MITKPEKGSYPSYFEPYVQLVEGDVLKLLKTQRNQMKHLLTNAKNLDYKYGPDKWSIKQVVRHLIDTERVFSYRAMCISRGEKNALPSFDHNAYAEVSLNHLDAHQLWKEYNTIRKSSIQLFRNMDNEMLERKGTASGKSIIVKAFAFMIVGHQMHHFNIIRDRYQVNG